ncbi:MAG: DUF2917 domain-containing protein [Verrucomicrobiota bacterium]
MRSVPDRLTSRRLLLAEGQLFARELAPGEVIEVSLSRGALWLTLEGDPTDHVLQAGHRATFSGAGKLVLESLEGPAELTLA